MDRATIQVHVSTLIDSSQYLNVPIDERVSMLSRMLTRYSSSFADEGYGGDEETAIGYESSWSGIFPTCGG